MSLMIRATVCPDTGEWVATCADYPSLSWIEPSWLDAVEGLHLLIDDLRRDIAEAGE